MSMLEQLRVLRLNEMGQCFTPMDTTLRDGAQSPIINYAKKFQFELEDKVAIIDHLYALGVRNFELFSPIVSDYDKDHFIAIKEYVLSRYPDARLLAHVRCLDKDIQAALDVGADGLNIYLNSSVFGQQNSHHMDLPRILSAVKDVVGNVRQQFPDLYMRYSSEDFFRTDRRVTNQVFDVAAEFINTLGIPDTVGVATPAKVRAAIRAIRHQYPDVHIECHFHNDEGRTLENAEAAIISGDGYVIIDTSVWGLAERNGITSLPSLLFRLYIRNPRYCDGFTIANSYRVNVLMGGILDREVPESELVSLTNRTHKAGVHSNAVLRNNRVYEAHRLDLFGVDKSELLLSPYCGSNHIFYLLKEFYYYNVSREQANAVFIQFKNRVNEIGKGKKTPEELLLDIVNLNGLQQLPEATTMQQVMFENLGNGENA